MQGAFSTVFLPVAVPVTHPLCPPRGPHPMVGWLPCALSRFISTTSGMLARPTWGAQALSASYHITNFCTSGRRGASRVISCEFAMFTESATRDENAAEMCYPPPERSSALRSSSAGKDEPVC